MGKYSKNQTLVLNNGAPEVLPNKIIIMECFETEVSYFENVMSDCNANNGNVMVLSEKGYTYLAKQDNKIVQFSERILDNWYKSEN